MGRKIARIAGIAKIARILLRSGFQFWQLPDFGSDGNQL